MRRLARILLLAFVFAVPWQYSVDFPAPVGNAARVLGLAMALACLWAVMQAGRMRALEPIHWLTLALLAWSSLTYFWSADAPATLAHVRGNAQEMLVLWIAWELVDDPAQLRHMLRAFVAGSLVLAALTIAMTAIPEAAGQARFAPPGQDPNDVARFLDLALPLAALLCRYDPSRLVRLMSLLYLPAGLIGVLLTASRGGVVAASVALVGSAIVLGRRSGRRMLPALVIAPVGLAMIAVVLPAETIQRILTIREQLSAGGDLNQRLGIWAAGAQAMARAPFLGSGSGSFVTVAGLAPADTAHNTALAIAVEGGVVALTIALAILVRTVRSAWRTAGSLRDALLGALAVWVVTSMAATVHENRTTWVLIAIIMVARRLAHEDALSTDAAFQSTRLSSAESAIRVAQ